MPGSRPDPPHPVPHIPHHPPRLLRYDVTPPLRQYPERNQEPQRQDRKGIKPGVEARQRPEDQRPLQERRHEDDVLQPLYLHGAGLVRRVDALRALDVERTRLLRRELELEVRRQRDGRHGHEGHPRLQGVPGSPLRETVRRDGGGGLRAVVYGGRERVEGVAAGRGQDAGPAAAVHGWRREGSRVSVCAAGCARR